MAQATFSVRMDETLKKQFDALCNDFGMNATTAFNIFAKAVVRERRIPFEISSPAMDENGMRSFMALRDEAKKNGIQNMSLDEIDSEIADVKEKLANGTQPVFSNIDSLREALEK